MYTVLLTYGLNPATGFKLMMKSTDRSLWQTLFRQMVAPKPQMQLSVGTLMPEGSEHLNRWQKLAQLRFFVALESPDLSRPALPSGRSTALQVYHQGEGLGRYKAEVVRFRLGSKRRLRRRAS